MYAIIGASGNSGHIVAEKLLAAGKKVRAIGRSAERLQLLTSRGAEPYICQLENRAALAKAFADTDGVYAMMPPDMTSADYRAQQDQITDALAAALAESKVKHVVALSSFGADKTAKTGPVVGLHQLEEKLSRIPDLNALCLRPGYFMENTLAQIGIIKAIGVAAGPLRPEVELPMIATRDIGAAAAERLLRLDFSGFQTQELLGQRDISMAEAAGVIGRAISRPHLAYVRPTNDEVRGSLLQMGASENMSDLILEMAEALNAGHMAALEKRSPENTTPTSYETFVKEEFVPRFMGKPATA